MNIRFFFEVAEDLKRAFALVFKITVRIVSTKGRGLQR